MRVTQAAAMIQSTPRMSGQREPPFADQEESSTGGRSLANLGVSNE